MLREGAGPGPRPKRLAGAAIAAAAVAGAALAGPAQASAGNGAQAPVSITILSGDQAAILRTKVVRARLSARAPMHVRAFALSGPPKGPGGVATATRILRLGPRRPATARLRLARAGRLDLASCQARTLRVQAFRVHGRQQLPGAGYSVKRALKLRRGACRKAAQSNGAWPAGSSHRPINYQSANADRCDFIDPAVCLQPFPNDYFTVADPTTQTGRRVNLNLLSMPRNIANKPIDPSDINRNDGFGPGSPIVTKVPGMDTPQAFAKTGAVPIDHLGQAFARSQPVVVINARTLKRQLVWSEIDANPQNPADVNLVIHPARNLAEGGRYIVVLRRMRNAQGHVVRPSKGFRVLRDRALTTSSAVEARRRHFEGIFRRLAAAGIDRQGLYRAWDFTVASRQSLSERQLAIRNDAFQKLGDTNLADLTIQGSSPAFQITKVTNFSQAQDPQIARQVEGTVTTPCYLNAPGCPTGSRFAYPPGSTHGPPTWIPGNTTPTRFVCNIPRVAMAQGGARPSLYGHGLFGSRYELNQGQLKAMAQEHDFVFCSTDWIGMACTDLPPSDPNGLAALLAAIAAGNPPNLPDCDVPAAVAAENDLSNFPTLVDRVDQSFVNFMYLGRALIHPQGFSQNAAFQDASGHSVLDTRRLFYDGNSQGGVFGGSLVALEPDLQRGTLGVSGMNYSLLLQRSSDFGTGAPPQPNPTDPGSAIPNYAYFLYQAYPNQLERQLILSLIQQMWDHSDPSGLAAHMTSRPLPDTPPHQVLMQVAFGDHQVSNWAAAVEARTIGARLHMPAVARSRDPRRGRTYFDRIPAIPRYPWPGSAIVPWDSGPIRDNCQAGNGPPPFTNTPPIPGCPAAMDPSSWGGNDPHEEPRNTVAARLQKSRFLSLHGKVVDACKRRPCPSRGWRGAP